MPPSLPTHTCPAQGGPCHLPTKGIAADSQGGWWQQQSEVGQCRPRTSGGANPAWGARKVQATSGPRGDWREEDQEAQVMEGKERERQCDGSREQGWPQ